MGKGKLLLTFYLLVCKLERAMDATLQWGPLIDRSGCNLQKQR